MKVKCIAHTQLSEQYKRELTETANKVTSGQIIALTAIRTCYSHLKPSEIVLIEGEKYFAATATDGEGGSESDRLFRHIVNSGHTSTLEHINYTYAVEGISRTLLAQLTRHRHFSFSVQSQRYVKFGSEDKSRGFAFHLPGTIKNNQEAQQIYESLMNQIQEMYDTLRSYNIPAEDARMVLPNAALTNLVLTGNLRTILEFYRKRNKTTHAQSEIQELAEKLREEVTKIDPWTKPFFELI